MSFTYNYSQPEAYHFSLDSVLMAEQVAAQLRGRKDLETLRVLDLCAGCGVIGFELSWHLRELRIFDFVEVQDVYEKHFLENKQLVSRPQVQWNFHLLNYAALRESRWQETIDVIVCNPPYFRLGQGKLSPSEFKNRCRFYIDSDFQNLIQSILWVLKSGASAYLLLRPLQDHAWDMLRELETQLVGKAAWSKIGDVRGTDLLHIRKL